MEQAQVNLLEDQSSRKKKEQLFIIFLIIFFTLIICAIISVFTVLKHNEESESPSANPTEAIRVACQVTRYHSRCIRSLSSLHNPGHKIYASDVFRLSIDAAFQKFLIVHELPQHFASKIENKNIRPVLTDCQNLFNDSLNQLNRSLIMISEILDYDDRMIKYLRNLMDQAMKNVDRCKDGLSLDMEGTTQEEILTIKNIKEGIHLVKTNMLISLDILENKDLIRKIFDPRFQSFLPSFMFTREYYMSSLVVFCPQYLFLVFLFGSLLRVFRRKTRK